MTQPDGRLFSDPDPDAARAAFAKQPRALADKRTTVAEAVAKHVNDGDYLAIGGFGVNRIPTARVRFSSSSTGSRAKLPFATARSKSPSRPNRRRTRRCPVRSGRRFRVWFRPLRWNSISN